jgi:HTH-type transcriptional regulator, transcriptional repressor of NAD biosynthesis genes
MVKGFVFGKFLPFHKGHEAMIKFALTKCDFLKILICCSDKEDIPCVTRRSWIEKTFGQIENIEIATFNYSETELPNTSESSIEISKIWSQKFKGSFTDYHLVVTSEEYGSYVASFMGIQHVPFDIGRVLFSVSASGIRNDLFGNWQFLPDSVKPDFALKVVILGTESTGKSILTRRLAEKFNCTAVGEAGRDLIADSKKFEFKDLAMVACEHARRIDAAVIGESPLIIIDTDIHITESYAEFIFDKQLVVGSEIYNSNRGHLYLYLNSDVDYIQDGTRLNVSDRERLDLSHRKILKRHNIDFVEITGSWEQRFEKAFSTISDLIKHKRNMHWA